MTTPIRDQSRAMLAAARSGDEGAIAEVVREVWPGAWRAALAVSGSPETAEDATQDALERAFRNLGRFETPAHLAAWLRSVATRQAIDMRRRDDARTQRERTHTMAPREIAGPGAGLAWESVDPELLEACRRLSPEARWVVLLHFWADMDLGEIAVVLGVPVGTVKSRLARALARLRDDLGDMREGTDGDD